MDRPQLLFLRLLLSLGDLLELLVDLRQLGVGELILSVSDPPTQAEVQQIADKLDELINALRR